MTGPPGALAPAAVLTDDTGSETEYFRLSELVKFTPKQRLLWRMIHEKKFTLYGGARGGGKSYGLRWLMICLLLEWWAVYQIPGIRVAIFCETIRALKDRQISKVRLEFPSWLGTWNATDLEFRLHDEYGGGILCFRNLDEPDKYRSVEFAAMGIDELTLNPITVFTELMGSLRWPGIEHNPFIGCSNPTGLGHAWVKDLFITKEFALEETKNLVTPEEEGGEAMYSPDDFYYIKALPTDNPHNAKSYIRQLRALPDRMREAFFYGSWDHFEGMAFEEWDRDVHIVPNRLPPKSWRYYAGMDWGYRKGYYCLAAIGPEGDIEIVWEHYFSKRTARVAAVEIALRSEKLPRPEVIYGDEQMWQKTGNEATLADEFLAGLLKAYGSLAAAPILERGTHGPGSRHAKYNLMKQYLTFTRSAKDKGGDVKPWNRPKLRFQERCRHAIRTIPTLPVDPDEPEDDVDTNAEDHPYDGVCFVLSARPRMPEDDSDPLDPDQHPGLDPDRRGRRKPWEEEAELEHLERGRVRAPRYPSSASPFARQKLTKITDEE